MNEEIPGVAILIAKPGAERQVEELLKSVILPTLAEGGANYYHLYKDRANPRCFIFKEEWKNQAVLDSHNASQHIVDLFKSLSGLLESVHVSFMDKIA